MTQAANAGRGSSGPVGSGERIVRQGECMMSIAIQTGHFWQFLWDHPANGEVKLLRGAPHVLLAGDRLHVPPIAPGVDTAPAEKRHRFRRKGIPLYFEIVVMEDGLPLKGSRYVLEIDGQLTDGTVPDDGMIRIPMSEKTRSGELRVHVDSSVRVYPLSFGDLDPPHTPAGAAGRLQNLGYLGSADDAELLAEAVGRFQSEHGLSESGRLDDATASKLAEVHGS